MIDRRPIVLVLAVIAASGCALVHERSSGDASAIDAGPCGAPMEYFEPGCTSEPGIRITPGCYQPCTGPGDDSCASGMICQQTNIDPCICSPGSICCRACGADEWLCLPWHSTPVHCEGRSYCDCTGTCAPLVDLSTGCICPCDEPFQCGGPPCDCDCGGATYLGCQFADRCPMTQVQCPPMQHAQLVDGCPICVAN